MRQVQATLASQQELAADRGHGVIQINGNASTAKHISSHQPRRSATDNDDLGLPTIQKIEFSHRTHFKFNSYHR